MGSWDGEVEELKRREKLARAQGGKAGIAKQHARGRLTIRERIDAFFDPGSFQEHGKATAIPDGTHPPVLIGGAPAARMGDQVIEVGPPNAISKGETTVLIG